MAFKGKKTVHIRVYKDDLLNIRKALDDVETDAKRINKIWKKSLFGVDEWLGK